MTRAAGRTGVGPTVTVAMEQHFPKAQRIVEDDLAGRLVPLGMRAVVWLTRPAYLRDWMVRSLEASAPGIWGGLMCRKRYIDERLVECAGEIDAVVNLGAGWDTRAYRLPALADVPTWEVDQPENIAPKLARLHKVFGGMPAHVTLVPMDLDHEDLAEVLSAHGYSLSSRTFFVFEAVTQYLTAAGMGATWSFLSRAAPGSRLAFTYVREDFVDGEALFGLEDLYEEYVVRDRTWLTGIDPGSVASLLKKHGWRLVEHPTYDDLAARYVAPTGRDLATTPIERMVYAEKAPG